jgi:hypothetical protein
MPYSYQNIARAVALRANQLDGGDAAARDAMYRAASIETGMTGVEVPYAALKHTILAVAKELAAMVGNSNNPLYRGTIATVSAPILKGGPIPTLDVNGNQFIGALDGFYDPSTGRSYTEGTKQQVDRYNDSDFWKIEPKQFYEDGTALQHTNPGYLVAAGCSWDEDAQSAIFDILPTQPASFTFVAANVNTANDTIAHTAHGLFTGAQVAVAQGTGGAVLPTTSPANELVDGGYAWAIVVDPNTLKFATSLSNALLNVPINITTAGTDGSTPNSITPLDSFGGGMCPLPQELEVLHWCKVLAVLAEEGWFVDEGKYYLDLVQEKENDIVEGRVKLMESPSLPSKTASAEPNKD